MEIIPSDEDKIENRIINVDISSKTTKYCEHVYYILSLEGDNQLIYDEIFTYLNKLRSWNIEKVLNKDVYSKIIEKFNEDTGFKDIVDILLLNYSDLFDIDDNI